MNEMEHEVCVATIRAIGRGIKTKVILQLVAWSFIAKGHETEGELILKFINEWMDPSTEGLSD
jgi:hypothetical protein